MKRAYLPHYLLVNRVVSIEWAFMGVCFGLYAVNAATRGFGWSGLFFSLLSVGAFLMLRRAVRIGRKLRRLRRALWVSPIV